MADRFDEMPPPMPRDPDYSSPQRADGKAGPYFVADVSLHEGHVKHGRIAGFSLRCDEGPRLGGTDTAPTPLGYFTTAIGF